MYEDVLYQTGRFRALLNQFLDTGYSQEMNENSVKAVPKWLAPLILRIIFRLKVNNYD